jgi:hypothetical protein
MRTAIAIGVLGLALVSRGAAAQTPTERERILGDFHRNVTVYTQRYECLDLPESLDAATPAPTIFTLPVAVVFRQLIANAIAGPAGAAVMGEAGATHHAVVLQPFPATELKDFPHVLTGVLPALPVPLEYRFIDRDLVIRDVDAEVIVAVLRDASGR